MGIDFQTETELYQRMVPALKVRVKDFQKQKVQEIQEIDIWKYLKKTKWREARGLSLAEMVQDILNVDVTSLLEFLVQKQQ